MFTEQNRVLYTTAAAQSPGLYPDLLFSAADGSYTCLPPVAAGKYQVSLDGTDWLLFLPSDLTEGSLNADPAAGKAWTERDGVVSYLDFRTITPDERSGLVLENTVNAPYEALKVFGKSGQKAKWNQAEGVTTQIQETGYNLLDCEAEWLPVGNDGEKGITNIVTGKGSVSFDFDGNGVPYLENQKAIHLKAGSYYVSGLNSGSLDSVGFSGISEPLWNSCNGVITVPEEGDYKFYIYPMSYAHSMTISNLMIVEGDTSKTYQEYGYSKPSPAYPSALTSHISAGSYQIPTSNGIYEVTLTEDLRGLDDTYRDFIRFDSVSGTGYLEQNTLLVRMTRANLAPYRNTSDVTYRFSGTSDFAKYLLKTNANAAILCNRLKRYHLTSELLANDIVGVSNYTESGMAYNNVYIFLSKSDIGITADDTADTMQEKAYTYLDENPLYILVGGYSYREELTFTKVESSTLPVLPWTAYGRNLLDIERLKGCLDSYPNGAEVTYLDNGYRLKNETDTVSGWQFGWQKNINPIKLEPNTDYTVSFDYKVISGNTWGRLGLCRNFIGTGSADFLVQAQCNADGRYSASFNSGDCDTVYLFMNLNNSSTAVPLEKEYTNIMLCKGSATAYEPFNPTPPEALEVSPDYPQKIYDLSDVTMTSRGRNLFDKSWINNIGSGRNEYHEGNGVYSMNYPSYYAVKSCINDPFPKIEAGSYILSFDCMIQTNTQNKKEVMVGIREAPLGAYLNTAQYFTLNENEVWEKVTVPFSVTEESKYALCIQPSGVKDYSATVYFKNIQIVKGTYTAETLLPFDSYRCTEAEIGLALPCVKLNNGANGYYTHTDAEGNRYLGDYIYKDGNKVYHVKNIETREFTGNETIGNYVHSGLVNKKFYVFQIFGTNVKTYYEENGIKKHWNYTSMMSSSIPVKWMFECNGDWCLCTGCTPGNWANCLLLGLPKTEVDKMAGDDVNAKGKAYWKSLFENGFSCTVKYITEPVTTDITDTELGQDFLNLKTAPYYTKLFADKEIGGISATYKHF